MKEGRRMKEGRKVKEGGKVREGRKEGRRKEGHYTYVYRHRKVHRLGKEEEEEE